MKAIVIIVLCGSALAADKEEKKGPITPPGIPAEVAAEFFRADGVIGRIKPAWDEAQADLQRAISTLQQVCGEKYQPALDGKRLVCKPRPELPKEAK
jgi:hypothetical protein